MNATAMTRRALPLVASMAAALIALSFGAVQAAPITKQVTVKPIIVCDNADATCANFATLEAEDDKIWSQAGIDVKFLSSVHLDNTAFLTTNADTIAGGGGPANEHVSLFNAGNALVGDPFTTMIINMYFVQNIADSGGGITYGLGCGAPIYAAFCGGKVGVIISDDIFAIDRLDTIAHELGHVLGLTHDDFGAGASAPDGIGAKNLMTNGTNRDTPTVIGDITPDGQNLDQLTNTQINTARSSQFALDIPEPASLAALTLGLAGLGFARRRRAA